MHKNFLTKFIAGANTSKFFSVPNYEDIAHSFYSELVRASRGQPSSISYQRTPMPSRPVLESGRITGIVIGGTNFEIASASLYAENNLTPLPGRSGGKIPTFTDRDTFLQFMDTLYDPVINDDQGLALNFAFPFNPSLGTFGELDGAIDYGTKEHPFFGMTKEPLGALLRQHYGKEIPITVGNDTICLTAFGDGLVVGSGFNIGLQIEEKGERIAVNLEAGNFNKFLPTPELETIDEASDNKGKNRFEKMLSGIYIPGHFNELAGKNAIETRVTSGHDISVLAISDNGDAGTLARDLLDRSARLTASSLAAVHKYKGGNRLTIATEGSLYWNGWHFPTTIQDQLLKLGVPAGDILCKKVADSAMKGAYALLTRTQ